MHAFREWHDALGTGRTRPRYPASESDHHQAHHAPGGRRPRGHHSAIAWLRTRSGGCIGGHLHAEPAAQPGEQTGNGNADHLPRLGALGGQHEQDGNQGHKTKATTCIGGSGKPSHHRGQFAPTISPSPSLLAITTTKSKGCPECWTQQVQANTAGKIHWVHEVYPGVKGKSKVGRDA